MKKLVLSLSLICLFVIVRAQSVDIKQGSLLQYTVIPPGTGSIISTLRMERISSDTITMGWQINERSGRRSMSKESINNSKNGYWDPPVDGEDIFMSPDQTMLTIGKASYRELKEKGKTQFDGETFVVNKEYGGEYTANGRKLKAIRVDSEKGFSHIWILENPDFPLILKYDGNPFLVDVELIDIKFLPGELKN